MDHILNILSGNCLGLFLGFQASTYEGQPRPSWDIHECYESLAHKPLQYSGKSTNHLEILFHAEDFLVVASIFGQFLVSIFWSKTSLKDLMFTIPV